MKRVNAMIEGAEGLPQEVRRGMLLRFLRDEEGALTWFSLTLLMLMLIMGGLALSLMRFEYTRTSLQQTADRGALAAAALTQGLDPTEVVTDYFNKEGLGPYLDHVDVQRGLNWREVTVDASIMQRTYFLPLVGIEHLNVPAHSIAQEKITKVEISLVLDVSRSMILYEDGTTANPQKFRNVKDAAKQFVSDVLSKDVDNNISISIIPYNGQVNLNAALYNKYNITNKPGIANVYCVDLPASVYYSPGIPRDLAMPATGLVDNFSSSNNTNGYVAHTNSSYGVPNELNRWCPPKGNNVVRLPNNNIATLQSQIENLEAIGATSINAGIKWGMAMLDPGTRPIFSELSTAGQIPAYFSERPLEYDDDVMKVIVLMTDGSNFAENRMNDATSGTGYRTGTSPIYVDSNSGYYSIHHPGYTGSSTNKYYTPATGNWTAFPYGGSTSQSCTGSGSNRVCTTVVNNGTASQQTWQNVWQNVRTSWVAWQLYARPLGGSSSSSRNSYYTAYMNAFRSQTSIDTMNSQLQSICSQAKSRGVIVYGIAFEAPAAGEWQIASCAAQATEQNDPKSSAYYFESNGSKISTDFKTIASNISQLRLTQ